MPEIVNINLNRPGVQFTLEDALQDYNAGKRMATQCVVIFLDTSEGRYRIGYQQSGMRMSAVVALLEIAKQHIINNEMEIGRNLLK